MRPASSVGGDFYDFFKLNDHELGVAVADVSGKGVPAALIMTASRSLLKSQAMQGTPPAQCLSLVNRSLCAENISSMFVSLFYGVLDFKTGTFTYSCAGHNHPYRIRSGSATQLEPVRGTVLGVDANLEYKENVVTLDRGERLVIYTDGVVEAFNKEREEYSDDRLQSLLSTHADATVEELVNLVMEDVVLHSGDTPQSDDITVLALEYVGPQ
jgi:sigma-B regulation protein RsbU (phosphoserine phosphatase)